MERALVEQDWRRTLITLGTNDIACVKAFYGPLLAVLDLGPMMESERELVHGAGTSLLSLIVPINGRHATAGNGCRISFAAEDSAVVDRFHEVTLAHGGASDGAPGLCGGGSPAVGEHALLMV